jgi:DNA-binding NarL/FixJ family response regulator
MMRNLILADVQDITRAGIKYLSAFMKNEIQNVLEPVNKISLINYLSGNNDALVVLDYTLFDFSAVNELLILYQRFPETDWLLFSDELSDSFLKFLVANDLPFSIVLKSSSATEIQMGLKSMFRGDTYICERVRSHLKTLVRDADTLMDHNLTQTEREILKEVALGKTTKEIAAERNLSFHTIITHRKNIFRKLEVNNVHEATKYAMRAGIVDMSEYYI